MRDIFLEEIFSFFNDVDWDTYLTMSIEELSWHWDKHALPFPKHTFLTQLKHLKQAQEKLPDWFHARCILPPISIEQASDQTVAFHRAQFFNPHTLVDLTAGLGSDFYAHQKKCTLAIAVESDKKLVQALDYNLKKLRTKNEVVHSQALDFLKENKIPIDLLFLDPARRDSQKSKIVQLNQMEPDIFSLIPYFSQAKHIYIKLSPLFQWQEALSIPGLSRIWAISKKGECKEIGIELGAQPQEKLQFRAVLAGKNSYDWGIEDRNPTVHFVQTGKYLYEADVSFWVLQAVSVLGHFFSFQGMVHPASYAFANEIIENYPGKIYEVLYFSEYQPKKIKKILKEKNIHKIMISKKNYPESVEKIRKQIGLPDGGQYSLLVSQGSDNQRYAWLVQALK